MGPKEVVAGSTDVSVVIRIMDSTDGTPETSVTSATTGLDLQYTRIGGTVTDLTESDLTNINDAHSDGGIKHIANGYYRVDVPDAAFAFGADWVIIEGTATGMVVYGPTIRLLDPINGLFASQTVGATGNDTTHFHAPAWTYGDDEINEYLAVIYDDSEAEYHIVRITDWVNSTKLATFTPALPASVQASTDLVALLGYLGDGAGLTEAGGTGDQFTGIPWNAAWDAEVQSEAADAIAAYFGSQISDSVNDAGASANTFQVTTSQGTNVLVGILRFTSGALSGEARLVHWTGTTIETADLDSIPAGLEEVGPFSAAPANSVTFVFNPLS